MSSVRPECGGAHEWLLQQSASTTSFEREALPHRDAIYSFALRLTRSRADAEDLVQETFLRAFRSWHRFQSGTRAKSWLFTICRNAFLRQRQRDQQRESAVRSATRRTPSTAAEAIVFPPAYQQDPERRFFRSIIDARILRVIQGMPTEFREVVLLSDLQEYSYAEIAAVLHVPLGTVKSRLYRGRRLLQEALHSYRPQ